MILLLLYLPFSAWMLPPEITEEETAPQTQELPDPSSEEKMENIFQTVTKKRPRSERAQLWILLSIMVMMCFLWGRTSLDSLYALNQPFCMSAMQLGKIGMVSSTTNLAAMVVYAAAEAAFPNNTIFWLYICSL